MPVCQQPANALEGGKYEKNEIFFLPLSSPARGEDKPIQIEKKFPPH
jgi:hypothetical protein